MDRRTFLAAISAAVAEPAISATPTTGDLNGDIAVIRDALRLHPGLYRYNTPGEIEARLAALKPAFIAAPDQAARYLELSRFLAAIRCGHTYGNFFNQSREVASELFDRSTRLPFRFRWLGRRMIVTADPERLDLRPGTEVIAIDGRPAATLLDSLMPYARADGHNDAKRRALLEVQGFDRVEYFDVFHGLVFGAPSGGLHQLELRTPDGARLSREAPALGLNRRRAEMGPQPAKDAALWDWRISADGVAVLTMPTWAVYDSKWDWRSWLKDRMDSLNGARGLVVDLRANEGGQDCGNPILARLADRPVQILGSERRVRFQKTPPALDGYLDTWDNSFRDLGVGAEPIGDGFFRLPAEAGVSSIPPEGPRFARPVAALIGPTCSSATFQFALLGQNNRLVRLFGEPTGGNRRGINGGAFFFVRLPASGLEFDLPLIGYFPPGHPPDAGVDPDVLVSPRVQDYASGADPVLEAAMSWIRAG
jgi:hypothetical protein